MREFISGGCNVENSGFSQEKNLVLAAVNEHISSIASGRDFGFVDGRDLEIDINSSCEALYWRDGNHWSPTGIRYLADKQPRDWWGNDQR